MAEVDTLPETARKPRKSVAFSEGHIVVDENGEVKEVNGTNDEKTTAESHSSRSPTLTPSADAEVDEVTEMFKNMSKKKKTKKPKEGEAENDGVAEDPPAESQTDLDLSAMKKKKKKKAAKPADASDDFESKLAEAGLGEDQAAEEAATTATKEQEEAVFDATEMAEGKGLWSHDSTQPIAYPLLLKRFFTLLHERNPDLASSGTKSYRIQPPQCLREGNKKTIFANISDICKRMKRSDEHVTQFLFAELGTSGSVDGSRRLVIKGRFQQKQIENVLRRYIVEYVTCKTCRSPDTELSKGENRLYFVTCNSCGSRRSVQAIKTGFSAQVGKRRRQQG